MLNPVTRRSGTMCTHHNILKHTANYQLHSEPDGTITTTRPNNAKLKPPDAARASCQAATTIGCDDHAR